MAEQLAEPTLHELLIVELERDLALANKEGISLHEMARAIVRGLEGDAKELVGEIRKVIQEKYEILND